MTYHDDGARRRDKKSARKKDPDKLSYLTTFQVIAYFSAGSVGIATFFGLRDELANSGVSGWIIAAAVSITVTAGIGTIYHYLLQFSAEIRK